MMCNVPVAVINTAAPWSAKRTHVAVEGRVGDAHLIWKSTYLSSDEDATAGVAELPVKLLLLIVELPPFGPEVSTLIPPPKLFATLLLNVLLLTFRAPRTKIAPPPPLSVLEKLSLKMLSVTFSFAKTKSAPPDPAAMLLMNTQPLIVKALTGE